MNNFLYFVVVIVALEVCSVTNGMIHMLFLMLLVLILQAAQDYTVLNYYYYVDCNTLASQEVYILNECIGDLYYYTNATLLFESNCNKVCIII